MAIERQLAALAPAALRLDRDQLMFAAGRAAERAAKNELSPGPSFHGGNAGWYWPAAAALMTAASVVLAVMLWRQNEPIAVVQGAAKPQAAVATIPERAPAREVPEVKRRSDWFYRSNWAARPTQGYLEVRYVALTRGLGDLPAERSTGDSQYDAPSKPATARGLLQELLPPSGRHVDTRS